MKNLHSLVDYLKENNLVLATAESCTGGEIMATLSKQGECGECLFIGYVTYHHQAKTKELGVKESTISKYSLTSEEVAIEMVKGVFKHKNVNLGIATTGIIGPESMDDIPPGTICFAWAFKLNNKIHVVSETKHFVNESPKDLPKKASLYALSKLKKYHEQMLKELK
ncbi:MAG: nicotinamide-nucleotide amidohydrolase family protein [Tatlockia sp.]|nr:nicotinamide-nucleotide amidohydrolase family protein [Tatlockia sp.]